MLRISRLAAAALAFWSATARSEPEATHVSLADLTSVMAPGCRVFSRNRSADNEDEAFESGLCAGVIRTIANIEHDMHLWGFCVPETVMGGQIISVVSLWIDHHPETLNQPEIPVVVNILKQTWPCSR
jgi:hypothetical protein